MTLFATAFTGILAMLAFAVGLQLLEERLHRHSTVWLCIGIGLATVCLWIAMGSP